MLAHKLNCVTDKSRLRIQFSLCLSDGAQVDGTYEDETFEFTIGDGQFVTELDSLIVGLEVDTEAVFFLAPEQAYGQPNPENIKSIAKSNFTADMNIEAGYVVAFDLPNGQQIPGTIVKIKDELIDVDFNHPLSGRNLVFKVTVKEIFD